MSDRVREILSWYASENPGVLNNLARLMYSGRLAGTGKFVILPVDQGFEHGPARSFAPNPPGYDPRYHFQLAIDAGCNAYAAPLGFLKAGAVEFAGRIPMILKLNNSDTLMKTEDPCSASSDLSSPVGGEGVRASGGPALPGLGRSSRRTLARLNGAPGASAPTVRAA
jgi:class I fructose-bisphosphate aldolase